MNMKKIGKVIGIGAAIAGAGLIALLRSKENAKYSQKWFESVSDDEFYAEREPIRKRARENGGDDDAERLLNLFNNEEIHRLNQKYEKEHPDAKPRYREHGWYLPNDD